MRWPRGQRTVVVFHVSEVPVPMHFCYRIRSVPAPIPINSYKVPIYRNSQKFTEIYRFFFLFSLSLFLLLAVCLAPPFRLPFLALFCSFEAHERTSLGRDAKAAEARYGGGRSGGGGGSRRGSQAGANEPFRGTAG